MSKWLAIISHGILFMDLWRNISNLARNMKSHSKVNKHGCLLYLVVCVKPFVLLKQCRMNYLVLLQQQQIHRSHIFHSPLCICCHAFSHHGSLSYLRRHWSAFVAARAVAYSSCIPLLAFFCWNQSGLIVEVIKR